MPNSIIDPLTSRLTLELEQYSIKKETKLSTHSLKRRYQRKYAPLKSMKCCSTSMITNGEGRVRMREGGRASFKGLRVCSSAYCCLCASSRSLRHSEKINGLLLAAFASGYDTNLMTLTLPRYGLTTERKSIILSKVMPQVWSRARMYCKRRGVELYTIKSVDNTIAEDGTWNIHTHSIVITSHRLDNLREFMWKTYKRMVDKMFGVKVHRYGYDFKRVDNIAGVQSYLTKAGTLGLELTSSTKGVCGGNLGFHKWLTTIIEDGTAETEENIYRYRSFLYSQKNKRQIAYSHNIRKLQELQPEVDEEEEEEIIVYDKLIGVSLFATAIRMGLDGAILDCITRFFNKGDNQDKFEEIDKLIDGSKNEFILGEYKVKEYKLLLTDWFNC